MNTFFSQKVGDVQLNYYSCDNNNGGIYGYTCIAGLMKIYPMFGNSDGFMHLGDDVVLRYSKISRFNTSLIWRPHTIGFLRNSTAPILINITNDIDDWVWYVLSRFFKCFIYFYLFEKLGQCLLDKKL